MSGKENQTDAAAAASPQRSAVNELEMEPSVSDQTVEGSAA